MGSISYKNIFSVVTDKKDVSCDLKMRSDLMITIRDYIIDRCWSDKEAADKLGLKQSQILDLKKGKIDKFTSIMLMGCRKFLK